MLQQFQIHSEFVSSLSSVHVPYSLIVEHNTPDRKQEQLFYCET
jgi:hypothetical protein